MVNAQPVEGWFPKLDSRLKAIAEGIRGLVVEADDELSESIKWGNPCYEKKGKVCYLASGKGYVALGFFNGAALTDPAGRIEGTGKKMRHVKVRSLGEAVPERVIGWVREAVSLNEAL